MIHAEIKGASIAALACAVLLRRFGSRVNIPELGAPMIPHLVINPATGQLFEDIFGISRQALRGHEIYRRLVSYHHVPEIISIRERTLVISSNVLHHLLASSAAAPEPHSSDWHIFAGGSPPEGALISSGRRTAWIFETCYQSDWAHTAIFESLPEGWLFAAPFSRRTGFIQMVLPFRPENPAAFCRYMTERTRLLKPGKIDIRDLVAGPLPCAAALHTQLTGHRWIATGASALRFDPISGDGTGTSLRSAILACATLRSIHAEAESIAYLEHYKLRLNLCFYQHLKACASHYEGAGFSASWLEEMAGIYGFPPLPPPEEKKMFSFQLNNYRLQAMA